MNRKLTGLCVAAAFGAVATLGAQTTATTSSQTSHGSMSDHEMTITGCLQKGADGNYILTNARADTSASTAGTTAGGTMTGSTGSTATTGTSGTTGATTATGATTTASRGAGMEPAMTWQLSGGEDLDKHVGHKIQVTGKAEGSSGSASSGYTAGTTAAGSTTTGTTGSTATGTTAETMEHQGSASSSAAHRFEVKTVKMVSTSCS